MIPSAARVHAEQVGTELIWPDQLAGSVATLPLRYDDAYRRDADVVLVNFYHLNDAIREQLYLRSVSRK